MVDPRPAGISPLLDLRHNHDITVCMDMEFDWKPCRPACAHTMLSALECTEHTQHSEMHCGLRSLSRVYRIVTSMHGRRAARAGFQIFLLRDRGSRSAERVAARRLCQILLFLVVRCVCDRMTGSSAVRSALDLLLPRPPAAYARLDDHYERSSERLSCMAETTPYDATAHR